MKHLLNNLSSEEKNSILEQHKGGKQIVIENFNKLINTKLGTVNPFVINEQSSVGQIPPTQTTTVQKTQPNNMKQELQKMVGFGRGVDYKGICDYCMKQDLSAGNPRAKAAANGFYDAILGGDNPFSNFGGGENKESPASKAGQALTNNLKNAEDICNMIQYYTTYTGADEQFCDALEGELTYKVDSSTNLQVMFGDPLYKVLSKS